MEKKPIKKIKFLDSTASNKSTAIVGGEASGILNWNDIKYPQFYDSYRTALLNFWIPDEVSMASDIKCWAKLNKNEQEVFKRINCLLSALDSVQTRFLLEVSLFVSDPSVHAVMAVNAQQEAVHNQSYPYILTALVNQVEQKQAFDDANKDPEMHKRNQFIMDIYEEFMSNPSADSLAKALVGSIILEGINFYSGFAFFYSLSKRQLMVGTSTMISYIHR